MTASILPLAKTQFSDSNGKPISGGSVYFYIPNTSTFKTTWQDSDQTVQNTNPVILDARGEALIYGNGQYRQVVYDIHGNLIWDQLTNAYVAQADLSNTTDATKGAGMVGFTYSLSYAAGTVGRWLKDLATSTGSSFIGFIQASAGAVLRTVQAKLRDHFGSKDYGAVGDGITDDRNAINAMLTNLTSDFSNFELYFPEGSYLIGSNLTIPTGAALRFHAGAKFIIPNGVTVTLSNPELLAGRQQIFSCAGTGKVVGTIRNDLIFPEWWGAIADGLHPPSGTDFSARATAAARNAPALQAALTFAGNQYTTNGLTGTVSLTYGYYVYDTTLSIPLSVNMIGYGIGSGLFYYAATGNAVEMVNTNNSLVSDIFIAPIAGPTWNYTSGIGLRVDNVSTPIVRNVWSSGFGGGCFYFKDAIEGRFYGLITDNANGNAYTIRGIGQGSVLDTCEATNTDIGTDFDIQSGYDWRLRDCTSKNQRATATNGFYLSGVENINLSGCGTHDSKHEGILLTSSVLNCTLTSCFVNGASVASSGAYAAMNISGTRNKLIAPKVTQNTPTYNYALILGGGGTDCSYIEENFTAGTVGIILDAQPIGTITTNIRKVTTSNATPINIWAKSLNNNAGVRLEATVLAKQHGDAGDIATYNFWALAKTTSLATSIVAGPTVVNSYESNALLDATFVLTDATANAGVVSLQITGLAAGLPIDWEAEVTSISVTG